MKVTFIGLGIMGSRMAAHLVSEGLQLTVFNRNLQKAEALADKGATVANSLEEAVGDAEVVITMLSTPAIVRELSAGESGFLQQMTKGALWMDCSTVSPADVAHYKEEATAHGVDYLEAPVAGTKQPAESGQLVFFVGGDKENLQRVSPLLELMGKKTIYMGGHGKAASIKIVINLMLAQSMLAFSEGVKLATGLGLPQEQVMGILLNVPVTAPFLQNIQEKLNEKDTTPNFPLQWMLKDLGLVQQSAGDEQLQLSLAQAAEETYRAALNSGLEDQDFSSVFHFINQ